MDSTRGGERFDRYAFSLIPYRMFEMLAPGVLGQPYGRNHAWRYALPPENDTTFWVASLYQGGLILILALFAMWRPRSAGVRGIALLALLALLASFGLYASPAGVGRWLPPLKGFLPVPQITSHSLSEADYLAGDGSPYYFLTLLIPGLELFRYPTKLYTWFSLGICVLASLGWDRLSEGQSKAIQRLALALMSLMIGLLVSVLLTQGFLVAWGTRAGRASQQSGPFDAALAWLALRNGLLQASLVFAAAAVILRIQAVRPQFAGLLAILLTCADLAVANHGLVWSVPQSVFDQASEAVTKLENARDSKSPPPRIHRPPVWYPFGWDLEGADDRIEQLTGWEKQTLQPLHGLPENLSYTLTLGIMESPRYLALFSPWLVPAGPVLGPMIGLAPNSQVLHYPRRAFDLWGTEYFLLPVDAAGWRDESRSYASFLEKTQPIVPGPETMADPEQSQAWRRKNDWQLLQNLSASPRAWVVHQVQVGPELDRLDEKQRQARIRAFFFQNDSLWSDPERPVLDLEQVAWVESAEPARDRPQLDPLEPNARELVSFERYTPDRVELNIDLGSRGLVVLSDSAAPGWIAELDGQPERIWRTNLGMRGVIVSAGHHRLIFRYRPVSFLWGAALSGLGLVITAGLFAASLVRRQAGG